MIRDSLENVIFGNDNTGLGETFNWGFLTPFDLENKDETSLKIIEENILQQKQLGLKSFKFSLSWSDIMPIETEVNLESLDFYSKIIAVCLKFELEPFVVFFDGNTPNWILDKGGWTNRAIVNWFENYVSTVVNCFESKVKYYVVFKETACFSEANQFLRKQIPTKKNIEKFIPSIHHAVLCQSVAAKTVKKNLIDAQIGTTFSFYSLNARTFLIKDLNATDRADALLNKIFIEPALGLGYPIELLPFLKNIKKHYIVGDDELIKTDFDFIFIQNISKVNIGYNSYVPYINAKIIELKNPSILKNEEITDNALFQMVLKFSKYKGVKKIFVLDNKLFVSNKFEVNKPEGIKSDAFIQTYFKHFVYIKSKISKFEGCYFFI
jgi:beta-glucosidase